MQKRRLLGVIGTVLLLAGVVSPVAAQEDIDGAIGVSGIYPNVFLIMDTSGSMAEVPYRTESGEPVEVKTRQWKKDILVDSSGAPIYDGSGNLQWT